MDFPLKLSDNVPVLGLDEFKQDLELILTEFRGAFLQSPQLGAHFDPHTTGEDILRYGIEQSLSKMRGVIIEDIKMELPTVYLRVKYYDNIVNFQFDLQIDEN